MDCPSFKRPDNNRMIKILLTIFMVAQIHHFHFDLSSQLVSPVFPSDYGLALPPCRCIADMPCPTSSFSHNGQCSCPTIQNGNFYQNYWQTGDVFERGCGPRTHTYTISFGRSFCKVPSVTASINALDTEHATNLRIKAFVDNVTATSFNINFNTWAETRIYAVGISYVAFV